MAATYKDSKSLIKSVGSKCRATKARPLYTIKQGICTKKSEKKQKKMKKSEKKLNFFQKGVAITIFLCIII